MRHEGEVKRRRWAWVAALLVCTPLLLVYASQPDAGTIPVTIGEHTVRVELAQTTLERSRGLMFRKEMADNRGMLFVFDDDEIRSFWMKNTFIPLTIAYIDRDKRIINMLDMIPINEEKTYRSAGPARYALEVNQGWFAARGVRPGDHVQFELLEAEAK